MENDSGKLAARLKRIEGQVSGVRRMVEEDRYCVDVLMQISATRAALAKVSQILLENHINTCVREAFESSNKRSAKTRLASFCAFLTRTATAETCHDHRFKLLLLRL